MLKEFRRTRFGMSFDLFSKIMARKVAGALKELSERLTAQGEKVPLRLFAVPCEQLL